MLVDKLGSTWVTGYHILNEALLACLLHPGRSRVVAGPGNLQLTLRSDPRVPVLAFMIRVMRMIRRAFRPLVPSILSGKWSHKRNPCNPWHIYLHGIGLRK